MAKLETALTSASIIESVYGYAPVHTVDQIQGAVDDYTLNDKFKGKFEGFNRVVKTLIVFKPDLDIAHATATMIFEAVGLHAEVDPQIRF